LSLLRGYGSNIVPVFERRPFRSRGSARLPEIIKTSRLGDSPMLHSPRQACRIAAEI
jgi:hypothetical protein